MREEIPVAPVAKYLSTGRCVIKGRYCDASANVGIRGCYPLSLINDDVLATQLQLSLRHLALSIFLPYSVLCFLSFSFSLSHPPFLFLSLSRFAATLERSSSVEADARPATTSDLHHPLSSAIQPPLPSRPLVRLSPSHRVTGYTALVHLERPTTRVTPRIQFRATCAHFFAPTVKSIADIIDRRFLDLRSLEGRGCIRIFFITLQKGLRELLHITGY